MIIKLIIIGKNILINIIYKILEKENKYIITFIGK